MKKMIFTLILLLISISSVSAKENRLILIEQNNKIYYDRNVFDRDYFMKFDGMLPNGKYHDELLIENNTNKKVTLYFKIEEKEQSDEQNELLDNLFMKLYLDNNLIYDGQVKGFDYNLNGVNLQNVVFLKELSQSDSLKFNVDLYLDPKYANKNMDDYARVDWIFYVQQMDTGEVTEVTGVPITGLNGNSIFVIISASIICLIGFIITLFVIRKGKVVR